VNRLISDHHGEALPRRIEAFSERLLGTPYVLDGFGEGPTGQYDQDPIERLDAFDCTTFVETVMALANAADFPSFVSGLQQIRYQHGEIAYFTRNHFTDLDWIPNNEGQGFIRDITQEAAGGLPVLTAEAWVNKRSWYEHKKLADLKVSGLTADERLARLESWRHEGDGTSPTRATVPYLALSTIFASAKSAQVLDHIPSGTIMNIVRPGWEIRDGEGKLITQMNISHQAWVIRKNGQTLIRHASPAGNHEVTEAPLADYLRLFLTHPTIKGINLLEVR
jgi:hypothetical protein